jgi:hypothetical protein
MSGLSRRVAAYLRHFPPVARWRRPTLAKTLTTRIKEPKSHSLENALTRLRQGHSFDVRFHGCGIPALTAISCMHGSAIGFVHGLRLRHCRQTAIDKCLAKHHSAALHLPPILSKGAVTLQEMQSLGGRDRRQHCAVDRG